MNNRLKTLRAYLELNQEDFGNKINLSRSHVASLEKGTRNLTERTLSDLSREFNVNETWLKTGEGEIFQTVSDHVVDNLAKEYNLKPLAKKIIETFVTLEESEMDSVLSFIKKLSNIKPEENSYDSDSSDNSMNNDIEEEVESYKLELEAEKKGITSQVLGDIKEERELKVD